MSVGWAQRWADNGDRSMRQADRDLEGDRFGGACQAYLTAAQHYWLALSDSTLSAPERRRLHDAHVSAFRAAIPLLPHPTAPFEVPLDDGVAAGYLFLPTRAGGTVPTVLWQAAPPVTPEAGYWQMAVPILESGSGCAVFTATSLSIDTAVSDLTRWLRSQPGVADVLNRSLRPAIPLRRS